MAAAATSHIATVSAQHAGSDALHRHARGSVQLSGMQIAACAITGCERRPLPSRAEA